MRVPPLYGQLHGLVQKEFVVDHTSLLDHENKCRTKCNALELSNHKEWEVLRA